MYRDKLNILAKFSNGSKEILKCEKDRINNYWNCTRIPIEPKPRRRKRNKR